MANLRLAVLNSEAQFVRLAESERPPVSFHLDGVCVGALLGDTVLTAILLHQHHLRSSEFCHQVRAGFCLMGACQDCWISAESGQRLRACLTPVSDGMRLVTARTVTEPVK